MSAEVQTAPATEQKQNDKEFNFRALEAKYERQLQQERQEREDLKKEIEELRRVSTRTDETEDDDSEPYVDHKRLNRKLAKFEEKTKKDTKADIEQAVQRAIYQERKKTFLDRNPDFYPTIQTHAEKLLQKDPELAETILEMPEGFERQKLVYKNIKALGLDKPEVKEPSIQEKVDANRRMPFYQPSGVAAPPFAVSGDFSDAGQKQAYSKMKELQKKLRLG